jgi:hypothetical protein
VLKKIYIALGAAMIGGYLGWSLLGFEWEGRVRDPDPTVYAPARASSGYSGRTGFFWGGRSRGSRFGSGFGFGK